MHRWHLKQLSSLLTPALCFRAGMPGSCAAH
jgi:hypothetical protein